VNFGYTSQEDLRVTKNLLATADVAVFDFAPGEVERSGLDAVTLRAANPALLHAWLPPYSPAGHWSQLPPDDGLFSALGAVSDLQLSFEDRPVHLVTPQVSYAQGMLAAGPIASGLYERAQSGEGRSLIVSGAAPLVDACAIPPADVGIADGAEAACRPAVLAVAVRRGLDDRAVSSGEGPGCPRRRSPRRSANSLRPSTPSRRAPS
jgi:crotonobetainyl-CoA:carnitine CoA-transferase CaiB-like acyl-CoA transferase